MITSKQKQAVAKIHSEAAGKEGQKDGQAIMNR